MGGKAEGMEAGRELEVLELKMRNAQLLARPRRSKPSTVTEKGRQ